MRDVDHGRGSATPHFARSSRVVPPASSMAPVWAAALRASSIEAGRWYEKFFIG
jgi:hypothetical protein